MTELIRVLQELLNAGVRFLVVGGYATIAHGYTRATEDLDIWIEPTLDNAARTRGALERSGVDMSSLSAADLIEPYSFFRIGETLGRKIDILSHAEGLVFNKAWLNRFETEFFGLSVPFLSVRDLIKNKKAVGRHKDLADVEGLQAFHGCPNDSSGDE